jgi:hypothetical protein
MDVVVKRARVLVAVFNQDLLRSIQLWDGSRGLPATQHNWLRRERLPILRLQMSARSEAANDIASPRI